MLKKISLFVLILVLLPLLYVNVLNSKYNYVNTTHCSAYNLRVTEDYDLERCQISGKSIIITRDGSGSYLYIKLTSPELVRAAQDELAVVPESDLAWSDKMFIVQNIESTETWDPPFEEGILLIGQYDFDRAVELSVSSHFLGSPPNQGGGEFMQINPDGSFSEETGSVTRFIMTYVSQFSALSIYVILVISVLLGAFYGIRHFSKN